MGQDFQGCRMSSGAGCAKQSPNCQYAIGWPTYARIFLPRFRDFLDALSNAMIFSESETLAASILLLCALLPSLSLIMVQLAA